MFRVLFFVISLFLAAPALAQTVEDVNARIDTVLGAHDGYEKAFADIQAAVKANDADALAAYIPYGVALHLNGEEVTLADADAFKARLAEFFNDKVKDAVTAQAYETLFVNADGVMFGIGQLWLGGICKDEACTTFDVKIIAFNNG